MDRPTGNLTLTKRSSLRGQQPFLECLLLPAEVIHRLFRHTAALCSMKRANSRLPERKSTEEIGRKTEENKM